MTTLKVRVVKPGRGVLCQIVDKGPDWGRPVYMRHDPGDLSEGDIFEARVTLHEYPRGSGQFHTQVEPQ